MPTRVHLSEGPTVSCFSCAGPSHSLLQRCILAVPFAHSSQSKLQTSTLARFTNLLLHSLRRRAPALSRAYEQVYTPTSWISKAGAGIRRLPSKMSNPENKLSESKQTSYLTAGINALSPWSSRSASPKQDQDGQKSTEPTLTSTKGGDHTVSHKHRLSLRKYPRDCPVLDVQWFHAIDVSPAVSFVSLTRPLDHVIHMGLKTSVSQAQAQSDW